MWLSGPLERLCGSAVGAASLLYIDPRCGDPRRKRVCAVEIIEHGLYVLRAPRRRRCVAILAPATAHPAKTTSTTVRVLWLFWMQFVDEVERSA